MPRFEIGELVYSNPLASPADVAGFRMEGEAAVSFPMKRMRLEGTRDPADGQRANIVHWCDRELPDNVAITWDFYPIREPGLCILFFAARGRAGQDLFDPALAPRSGPYEQYHHGDIDALHVSYFRRKHVSERAFTTCNLRKSHGFHLVAQGADPLPGVPDAVGPYQVELIKAGPHVRFSIGQGDNPPLVLFHWIDDGRAFGPTLTGGKIGFRQMTPMIAEYANLLVHEVRVQP
ncbi:MAG TPA: DUF1961 family protein [Tepidisphaeraceae bacterium]|jgi:hypothetical protein|nr:DUF1961 family protein [Tepidisphaeraceae bacterium]